MVVYWGWEERPGHAEKTGPVRGHCPTTQNGGIKTMGSPTKTTERSHWLAKMLVPKVILGCIVLALLAAAVLSFKDNFTIRNKTTKVGFENIGELATQEYRGTQVNVTTASREMFGVEIPFTQSKYIYSYDVIIKAGYDFSAITWEVTDKTITVTLPEAKILESYVDPDSFELYLESESIFRPITMEENNQALSELQKGAETTAVENGLMDNARKNAETILTAFFAQAYDLSEYTLTFE